MPRLTNRSALRAILHRDRIWAAYALADLAPGFFEHADWHYIPDDPDSLAMVLRLYELPIVFLTGAPASVSRLLEEIGPLPRFFFLVRPEGLPAFQERYRIAKSETMWRMYLENLTLYPHPAGEPNRLFIDELDALQRLYADGDSTQEAPDFFAPSMLENGVYFGIREGDALIAAAGTHLIAYEEGIGAVGNVYTRRDRRGRGLASCVVGVVAAELKQRGLPTIVLNVHIENMPARRVYTGLGFTPYCLYEEGIAESRYNKDKNRGKPVSDPLG